MKKKINNRAGIKKTKNKKQSKKKKSEQVIVVEKVNGNKEEVTFINWATLLSENSGLL